jgi:hypothetical protein
VAFGALLASLPNANAQPRLTGAVIFSTDRLDDPLDDGGNGGNADGGHQAWHTPSGGEINCFDNIYLTAANSGIGGPFINEPFTYSRQGVPSINVSLRPGTHTFHMFAEAAGLLEVVRGFYALNLFFDDDDTSPRISLYAPVDLAPSPPYPNFLISSATFTPHLDICSSISAQLGGYGPASRTVSFTNGHFAVTLTDFRWSSPEVEDLDRVPFAGVPTPDGFSDFVGHFSLTVTHVASETYNVTLNPGWNLLAIQLVNEIGYNVVGTPDGTDSIVFLNVPGARLFSKGRGCQYLAGTRWSCGGEPLLLDPGDAVWFYNPESFSTTIQISGTRAARGSPVSLGATPTSAGYHLPEPATYEQIVGAAPRAGTEVWRLLPGAQGLMPPQARNAFSVHRFDGVSWSPMAPVLGVGEAAVFVHLPDFNGDARVDRTDLILLQSQIRARSTDPRYDVNGDGKVDIADARALVLRFSNP